MAQKVDVRDNPGAMETQDRRFDFFKLTAALSFVALLALVLTPHTKPILYAKSLEFRLIFVPFSLAFVASLLMLLVTMGPREKQPTKLARPDQVDIFGFVLFVFSMGVTIAILTGLFALAVLRG